ncbi:TPA: helix-turn-helix domain-containing protein, partial [Escherichia coli]|nr:helix-turn-helix domain-containing protein [Escherichia coli]
TKGCLIANFATVPATEIAHQLSIARSTVYKILEDERAS